MNITLAPVSLSLLLLLEMAIPVVPALFHSVQIVSYNEARKTQNGPPLCALDQANETTTSSSLEDCSLKCAHDGTCTGFNIKNSLTCDHINTPVLDSTPRTITKRVKCTTTNRRSMHLCLRALIIRFVRFCPMH